MARLLEENIINNKLIGDCMKKILIHMNIPESGEYDIFHLTEPRKWNDVIVNKYNGGCPNVGNKLWFQAIISEITSDENELVYYDSNMSIDTINSEFDLVLAPMANVFSSGYIDLLNHLSEHFEKIKIPVYVVACGVQTDSYDTLDSLIDAIKEPANRFIKSIYNTGGEFALRGYFTKEFFKKLGYNSAVVTGCPSIYQFGLDYFDNFVDKKVDKKNFKPIFNGTLSKYIKLMKEYPLSEFIDQNCFYNILNDKNFLINNSIKQLIKIYGYDELVVLSEERVKLFPDMICWMNYLKNKGFNFSIGERIHGNIMPILSGIPSMVIAHDSRTMEMAEFFNIPFTTPYEFENSNSIYDLYLNMDYSKFKTTYREKYTKFEEFLKSIGIVSNINTNNDFMIGKDANVICENSDQLVRIKDELLSKKIYYKTFEFVYNIVKKIKV